MVTVTSLFKEFDVAKILVDQTLGKLMKEISKASDSLFTTLDDQAKNP